MYEQLLAVFPTAVSFLYPNAIRRGSARELCTGCRVLHFALTSNMGCNTIEVAANILEVVLLSVLAALTTFLNKTVDKG